MIELIILIFLLILSFISTINDIEIVNKGILMFLLLIFFIFIAQLFKHTHDISTIRMSEDIINVQKECIEETDRQMKDLSISVPSNALMNKDSPYRSLIELRRERINSLAETKKSILDAKMNICARKVRII